MADARPGAGIGGRPVGAGQRARRLVTRSLLRQQSRRAAVLPNLLPLLHATISPTCVPLIPALSNWRERAPPTYWSP